jgi:ParB family chromosome partitioning protein
MASTRKSLANVHANLEESMGLRLVDLNPRLTPVPNSRDAGRRPNRKVGKVEVNRVIPDPTQPRVEFSEDALEQLAKSIKEKGQLTPIRVRWSDELTKWVIISGERRWRAVQSADLTEIDCYFHESELSSSEILEEQLIENCLREDLQPIEEARAFLALMKLNGWTAKALADSLHVSPSRVSRVLALLRLPEGLQAKINAGEVSARSGYELSRLENEGTRNELAQKAAAGTITAEETARVVRQHRGKAKPAPRATKQTFVTEDGWKVIVTAQKKGSFHEIEKALSYALDEVRHRIEHGRQLF